MGTGNFPFAFLVAGFLGSSPSILIVGRAINHFTIVFFVLFVRYVLLFDVFKRSFPGSNRECVEFK